MAAGGVPFTDVQFELRVERFDMPTVRSLVAPSSEGSGCIFISLRGDGRVSATELTLDGRTPREAPLLPARNPGTYAAARFGARAWVIVDDTLHSLSLRTLQWDGAIEIPRGTPKARLVAAGEDSVLLCPATAQVRGMARASRGQDGRLAMSGVFEAAKPTVVLPGALEQWVFGGDGRWETREPSDALGPLVDTREIPRLIEPCSDGATLYALAADARGSTTTELVAIGAEIATAARKVCTICGIDAHGRVIATTEAQRGSRYPPGDNPSGIELIDARSLRPIARHSIGASNVGRCFGLCLPGAVAILTSKVLRVVAWDGTVATPRLARASIAPARL